MKSLQYIRTLFKKQPVSKPPAIKQTCHVTIGLDFGTSTTKCIVNLEGFESGKNKYLALSFPTEDSSNGTLCVPTAIGIEDDLLFFGLKATDIPQESIISSFKMAIPCIDSEWSSYESPFMIQDKPGFFQILGHELSAVDLSALYLATIIKQVKSRLSHYFRDNTNLQVYLNMAAPLDQLIQYYEMGENASEELKQKMSLENASRDTRISKHYLAMEQRTLRLSDQSQNPWLLQDALIALNEVKATGVLPLEKSPAYVVPEILAATTAYINRPRTRAGRFITFDVGAGTTDISVFWLEKHKEVTKPWYYSCGSLHTGMDDIDRSLSEILTQIAGHSLRYKREHLEITTGGIRNYIKSIKPVLSQIKRHKGKIFGLAYKKELKRTNWGTRNKAHVTLIMLGGGCQTDVIKDFGRLEIWENVLGTPSVETLQLDLAEKVLLPDCTETLLSSVPSLSEQSYLLVVAEGLANRIVDIPEYGVTSHPLYVPPVIPWDNYLDGHWW
jgi:hypothetical protein